MKAMIMLMLMLLITNLYLSNSQQNHKISLGSSLSPATPNSSYWSSKSGRFAFGFYPQSNGSFSVGIWFQNMKEKTVVWSVNPNYPRLLSREARLIFDGDGKLVLQDTRGDEADISTNSQPAVLASMLDTGNFVLYGPKSAILWQSFDSPTDTLLPQQPLVAGKRLVSAADVLSSTRRFQLVMQDDGNLVLYPLINGLQLLPYHAYWDTQTYILGRNVSLDLDTKGQLYLTNSSGVKLKNINSVGDQSQIGMYRLTLDVDGILRLYEHNLASRNGDWEVKWTPNGNKCDPIGLCGVNSYCELSRDQEARCVCLPSFDFLDQSNTRLGCGRNSSSEACGVRNESRMVSYMELDGVEWEDNSYSVVSSNRKDECEDECSRDCNCEVALFTSQQCSKQMFPLRFAKVTEATVTTMVKVRAEKRNRRETSGHRGTMFMIIGVAILSFGIFSIVGSVAAIFRFRAWGYREMKNESREFLEEVTMRAYKYSELEEATFGFTDRVGKGAFGTVFKGVIVSNNNDGRKIVAVKRLERVIADGEGEFRNEVKVIGKTHHRNLVKLLGYCHEGTHRLLVYEYMEKGSLADFLFGSKAKPGWEERMRITLNIARGILYLHEECETQIIHCDIKPENILMDDQNCAKIADFGLAKLLMPDQTRTYTQMRGTRGYVAPEWHRNMPITVKADVYSFGIVLLEMVCCRRSVDMDVPEDKVVLANWVFECFANDELDKLVEVEDTDELMKMIKLGLWCIQEDPISRPSMKKVCLMLEGTVQIPPPPNPTSSSITVVQIH